MKTVKSFSKAFLPCAIISLAVIIFGAVGFFTKGVNYSIEFVPGFMADVVLGENAGKVSADDLTALFTDRAASVKAISDEESDSANTFQIRIATKKIEKKVGSVAEGEVSDETETVYEEESQEDLKTLIKTTVETKYGTGSVAEVKNEQFATPGFAASLASKSVLLAIVTLAFIWLYATIRFHWDFAFGAILALVHDFLIMFTFITWSQVEFSTTTLAAILTIFGYSINATVVILDRVRENIKTSQLKTFKEIINKSVTDTLNRSIITTVTTLFASVSLLVFTSGSINDFAQVLTVGLISGCYSSMVISSGFIAFARRNWKPEYQNHVTRVAEISLD